MTNDLLHTDLAIAAPPQIYDGADWKAATVVALATIALPFSLTACLWRTFDAAHATAQQAPSLWTIQLWAVLPFLLLAASNAHFVSASYTRVQKWAGLLVGTLGLSLLFGQAEYRAFAAIFDSAPMPLQPDGLLMRASIETFCIFGVCLCVYSLIRRIRTRRAGKSAHLS